jgi:hypothetical protein
MVVGAMDRMWQGQAGGSGGAPGAADAALAAALADKAWAARRAVLLESSEGEDVYVQVGRGQVWCKVCVCAVPGGHPGVADVPVLLRDCNCALIMPVFNCCFSVMSQYTCLPPRSPPSRWWACT